MMFGRMIRAFCFCAIVVAAAVVADPAGALGAEEKVVDVRVQGNSRLTTEAILNRVKTRVGQPYDERVIQSDRQALLDWGQFQSVLVTRSPADQGVTVTFAVVERPLVTNIVFDGNKALGDATLQAALPFGSADPLNQANVNAGRRALENAYKAEGYYFATVVVDADALAREHRAVYHIVEGSRVVVKKVDFRGNTSYSNFNLKQRVGTKGRLWPFITGYLNTDQLKQDVDAARNFYHSQGFLDCQVDYTLEFSDDKSKVTVVFVIEEGPRFRVNELIFKGNTVISADELARRMKLARGEFFTAEALRHDQTTIQDTYGELGYIEVTVRIRHQFLPPDGPVPAWAAGLPEVQPALLNVTITIVERDQYRVGTIVIRGNADTQERIIRRELRIFPEQLFNTVAVQESRRRLQETRLFDEVRVDPVPTDQKGVRNVLVSVKEGRTAEFIIGVGYSTNSGALGNITFTQRNFDLFAPGKGFKGAGQTLRIVAEPGTEMMRFYIDWFEPYLFDQPYSLGVRAFAWTRQREDWDETRYGTVVSVGHRFKNRWDGQLSMRLESVDISDVDSSASTEISDEEGGHILLGFKGALVRDRTDSRWLPTRGDRWRFSYEQVVGDYTFGNAEGSYTIYRTLYTDALDRKHVLSARVAAGHIIGDAPFFERYYGGGIGSVRGFKYRGISPRDGADDDPIGGDWMFFAGTEYSFPIVGRDLRGVVFLDSGTVEESFGFSDYRVSVGAGLRITIPMFGPVPMSLDFGVPIMKNGDDNTQLLNFSVGWTW